MLSPHADAAEQKSENKTKRNELLSPAALPEHLKWGKHSRDDVCSVGKDLHGSEGDLDGPRKTQDDIFYNGTIVVCLRSNKNKTAQQTPSASKRPHQVFGKLQNLLLKFKQNEGISLGNEK